MAFCYINNKDCHIFFNMTVFIKISIVILIANFQSHYPITSNRLLS